MTPEELDRLERLCAAWPDYRPGATDTWIAAARTALPDLIAEVRQLQIRFEGVMLGRDEALAEVERLREALKPFAEASASLKHDEHSLVIIVRESLFQAAADYLRVADLHRANEAFALAPIPPGQEGEGK